MEKIQINPIQLICEHHSALQERLTSTADPHEKSVLYRRLRNLRRVKEFLVSAKTDA